MNKSIFVVQGIRKALEIGRRNTTKIKKNRSPDTKCSFLLLLGAVGSPQDAKERYRACHITRLRTKYNNIRSQKSQESQALE